MNDDFQRAATETRRGGLLGDLIGWLAATKKWWLMPIVVAMLLLGLLMVLSSSAAGPLLYTLF